MVAAAAAGAMLQLVIDEGPRRGETMEFPATSKVIRIGRVVKGNNVAIKDPGISQKHLRIEPLPSGGWTLTDLDTSNGTHLNGSLISPSIPLPLSHGDCIKIGESTAISVCIVTPDEEEIVDQKADAAPAPVEKQVASRGRRVGTRANPSTVPDTIQVVETRGRGRGGSRKGGASTRSTRSVEVQIPEEEGEKLMESREEEDGGGGVVKTSEKKASEGRGGRRRQRGSSRMGGVSTRSTRSSTRSMEVQKPGMEEADAEGEKLTESREEEGGGGGGLGEAIRTMTNPSNVETSEINPAEGREGRRRQRGSSRMGGVSTRSTRTLKLQEDMLQKPVEAKKSGMNEVEEEDGEKVVESREEDAIGVEEAVGNDHSDWEKMSLGDWFDRMAVHISQVIHEEADQVITRITEKVERSKEGVRRDLLVK